MADSILKLRVESSEYDNKIKRAAEGLQRYADQCHKAGGTLTQLDDGVLEFTRALGHMETVSKSAKGSINEMTKAFTDMSVRYKELTAEEKNAPYGQALKGSLDELRGRIQAGKRELADINKEINGGGGLTGALDSLAGKFGMNIKQLTGWGAALGVAKAALDVAKDAFNSSRDLVDEWGRTIQSAQSIYGGFLNALNTGDFSGFIGNMDDIAKAAREAYDAVSDLELLNAYNAGSLQRAKTGFTGSVADYRAGEGSVQGVKEAAETLKNQLRERKTAELNALAKAVNEEALKWGMDGKTLSEALKENFSEFTNRMHSNKPESYTGTGYAPNWGSFTVSSAMTGAISPIRTTRIPGTAEEKLSDFARRATPELLQKLRKYEVMSEATEEEIRQIDKQVTRMLGKAGKTAGSVGKIGNAEVATVTGSIDEQTKKVQELQKAWRAAADDDSRQKIKTEIEEQQHVLDYMTGKTKVADISSVQGTTPTFGENPFEKYKDAAIELVTPLQALENELKSLQEAQAKAWSPDVFAAYQQKIDEVRGKIGVFKDVKKDADDSAKSFRKAASAVSTVGSAMQSLEDPSAKIMGIIAQAVANIALAFSKADVKDGETGNVWYWIAATAAGVATMVSTISSIKSATSGYAGGGMIKGNSYSGDNIGGIVDGSQFVGLDAGEVVLNASQQQTLASNLQGSGGGNMEIVGVLTGENVVLMADRWGRRTGKGELLFAKNL